jgi:predicted GNAT family N-acyltransferase
MPSSHYQCLICRWSEHETDIRSIRQRVFIDELGIAPELEWDEQDQDAQYVLIFDKSKAIASGRLLATGQIGRMAVLPEYRGQGVGTMLLQALVDLGSAGEFNQLWCTAQTPAQGFYQKYGFSPEGEVFVAADIPHIKMTLILKE